MPNPFRVFHVTRVALLVKKRRRKKKKKKRRDIPDLKLNTNSCFGAFDYSCTWKEIEPDLCVISKSGLGAIHLQLYLLIMHMGPGLCLTHQTAHTQFVLTSDKGRQFGEPVNIENDRHGSIRQEIYTPERCTMQKR